MEVASPLSLPSPKPSKKTFISSLMEAAALRSPSYREDTYFTFHLKPSEQKALHHLKQTLLTSAAAPHLSMWGISLLDSDDRRGDVLLLKFLCARDFRAQDAADMLLRCLAWRRDFAADTVPYEDLGFKELEGVVAYMHGSDRGGRPVCYNAYGVFKDKEC